MFTKLPKDVVNIVYRYIHQNKWTTIMLELYKLTYGIRIFIDHNQKCINKMCEHQLKHTFVYRKSKYTGHWCLMIKEFDMNVNEQLNIWKNLYDN